MLCCTGSPFPKAKHHLQRSWQCTFMFAPRGQPFCDTDRDRAINLQHFRKHVAGKVRQCAKSFVCALLQQKEAFFVGCNFRCQTSSDSSGRGTKGTATLKQKQERNQPNKIRGEENTNSKCSTGPYKTKTKPTCESPVARRVDRSRGMNTSCSPNCQCLIFPFEGGSTNGRLALQLQQTNGVLHI